MLASFVLATLVATSSSMALADSRHGLIGGKETARADYPELLYISVNDGKGLCSATAIGPRTVLTAAHCYGRTGEIKDAVLLTSNLVSFKAQCEQAPLYSNNIEDHDMALCKTERDLGLPSYASVGTVGPKIGDVITLSGYGCKSGTTPRGGNDGILRVGEASVTRLVSEHQHWFYTVGSSALCFGDSGGPAYQRVKNVKDHHVVLGVNSRGDMSKTSLLTALYTKASRDFLTEWAARENVEVCGVNKDCTKDVPPAPKPPKSDCKEAIQELWDAVVGLKACLKSNDLSDDFDKIYYRLPHTLPE